MSILNTLTIKTRMFLSFAVLIVLFTIFGFTSVNQMGILGNLTSTLYDHPLHVSNAALKARAGIISMHRSMKDVSTSATQFAITMAIQTVQSEEQKVYQEIETIKAHILGDEGKNLVEETMELFAGWKPIRIEVEELVLEGNMIAANKITREKGAAYVVRLERKMTELTTYALNKADNFVKDAKIIESKLLKQTVLFVLFMVLITVLIAYLMSSSILSSVVSLKNTMTKITNTGELVKADLNGNNEITEMSEHFNRLIDRLKDLFWLSDGQNELNNNLSGEQTYEQVVTESLESISRYVNACAGALYSYNENSGLCELKSSYALVEGKHFSSTFKLGEGIIGQVAMRNKSIMLKNINRQDAVGQSGTISEPPQFIYALPLFHEKKLYGVLEIASFEKITETKQQFLDLAATIISVVLHTVSQNEQIKNLLEVSREANEKLQSQTDELQTQTEELQAMNEEFQQQANELKEQNIELAAQRQQVEEANRLKSEFLSNMSHELRTPLNSVNALSRVLILQASEKLSGEEINFLEIIERNGKHLLSLINDILDLSKIEAGRMDISLSHFSIKSVIENIMESVKPLADEKNIKLDCKFSENLPEIESDEPRVYQIVQNIIANGVKFTDKGSVLISTDNDDKHLRINIKDTGIGISEGNLESIFDEFRQVDGASTRKYEGTGLGLAIAHKAAKILGGEITLKSTKGIGSVFTIILPVAYDGPKKILDAIDTYVTRPPQKNELKEKKTILIVDDDPRILELIARVFSDQGYATLTTTSGNEAIILAEIHQPFAITMDVIMPGMDGWEVLSVLKKNPLTLHIPVIIVSVSNDKNTGFALGAVGYVTKPVIKESLISELNKIYSYLPSSIMIVDDNAMDRKHAAEIITAEGMKVLLADSGKSCLKLLQSSQPDVIVLDLVMPDMDGFEVLEAIRNTPETNDLPVIIVTAKDLSHEEKQTLNKTVSSILLKSETNSTELMERLKILLDKIGKKGLVFDQKNRNKILLVEDNDAAVIQVKKALEIIGLHVDVARDGVEALEYIQHTIPQGIILDLMMPHLDGFEVLETIRGTRKTKNIPVLILTAKDLTKEDLKRLSSNNIRQLIQKGDVDREELLNKVKLMIGTLSDPSIQKEKVLPGDYNPPVKTRNTPVVLVVEDNPDNMTTINAVIRGEYTIEEAVDGEEGLQKATELIPDLILLDVSLPKLDGLSVVKELKKNDQTKHIPVIALTAQAMMGDKEKIIDSGYDDYIAKPIDPEGVVDILEKWLLKASKEIS